ncbi:hypothetical protein [Pseudobacteriovorax antillogorgiicola]|uniref:Lipoprotein n=1 Tax=Pseudobacteriovorax antillogorgiicola TaxID=1513793 RepID=A0A1Y6BII0_9BACT|nr:hypothetical protein [Pseudobacteriovorax antillogorgiicola]TCS55531.1 hypothetical protein EDD56_105254 [Pseudobacteriovorax antillogorgiicola]SMF11287.1 hypothetical protein SAMN06296036_10570 [Pseudobacteriovorax antillogorgiicola]
MNLRFALVSFSAPILLLASCGGKNGKKVEYKRDISGVSAYFSDDFVDVNVNSNNRDTPPGLRLASPDAFKYTVTGCISGYEILTGDQDDTNFQVQSGDVNCVFRLTELTVNSTVYDLSGVSTWSGGSVFTVTNGANELHVVVAKQLPNTISGDSNVTISYGSLGQGTDGSITANQGTNLSISGDSIDLDLSSSSATVDGATGNGIFTFDLDCDTTISLGTCNSIDLAGLVVSLDNNSGGNDLDLATCQALAQTGGTSLHVGADGTTTSSTQQFTGPGVMFDTDYQSLVLTIYDDTSKSCKYFKIQIQP